MKSQLVAGSSSTPAQRTIKLPVVNNPNLVPEIADTEAERKDLYFGTLVERLMTHIQKRKDYDIGRKGFRTRISWSNIARITGLTRRAVVHYLAQRDRPMKVEILDKLLWATKLSILDLLTPSEILSFIESMSYEDRDYLRYSIKKIVDRAEELKDTRASAEKADSQDPSR